MPNWCNNSVTLRFPTKEEASEFKNVLENQSDTNTVLGYFVPEPDYDTTTDDATPGWYWWRVNNWGTKWDACHVQITEEEENYLEICFDTAWSPATPVIEKIRELTPYIAHFNLLLANI